MQRLYYFPLSLSLSSAESGGGVPPKVGRDNHPTEGIGNTPRVPDNATALDPNENDIDSKRVDRPTKLRLFRFVNSRSDGRRHQQPDYHHYHHGVHPEVQLPALYTHTHTHTHTQPQLAHNKQINIYNRISTNIVTHKDILVLPIISRHSALTILILTTLTWTLYHLLSWPRYKFWFNLIDWITRH